MPRLKVVDEGAVGECCGFPNAKRDDSVDCWSQLMAWCAENGKAATRAHALNVW